GFNNKGVDFAIEQIKKLPHRERYIIGGNIGKNKLTPNEDAVDDYVKCFNVLFDYVDYFVVNVISPNTPGLRDLQEKEPLLYILKYLQQYNNQNEIPKPILLKIAPDLTDSQLDDIIDIVSESKIAGVIATNTTISREGLKSDPEIVKEAGGVSGKPLKERSTEVIRYLSEKSNKAFPIIGVGGIYTAEDAIEKLEAGASLLQVYSGFIYEGPTIVSNICKGLVNKGIK
ncbi:quinone-dependent dihydroorotate dehydrogenase, partial [Algoriella sp.]|uniref:quinone-dependent dihydroorotate dehydrogenase n=1 Tax=Algoriella sp. TaxID=1872434 RepID=UPI001B1187FB